MSAEIFSYNWVKAIVLFSTIYHGLNLQLVLFLQYLKLHPPIKLSKLAITFQTSLSSGIPSLSSETNNISVLAGKNLSLVGEMLWRIPFRCSFSISKYYTKLN